jgi:hypothetical protein
MWVVLPLKQAYKNKLRVLADSHINSVDKKAFLAAFNQVFAEYSLKKNILSSFMATSLCPHSPEVALSKLEVKPRTPTLPPPGPIPWQPKTPSNV